MNEEKRGPGRPPKVQIPESPLQAAEHSELDRDPRRRPERRTNPRAEAERMRDRGIVGDRVPLGVRQLKMTLRDYEGQTKGFHTHWINDDGDRIQRAIRGGYMPVYKDALEVGEGDDDSYNPEQETWVNMVVGTHEGGRPKLAYAMKIRQDWYDADQAKKQEAVDSVDEQIRRGLINQGGDDKRYLKTAHYQIGSKR